VLVVIGVLGVIISIFVLMVSRRLAFRLFLASIAVVVLGSLIRVPTIHLPWSPSPGGSEALAARASQAGGWTLTIPEVAGATSYRVTVNGSAVGSFVAPGDHDVPEPAWSADQYGPSPVRTIEVVASGPSVAQTLKTDVCAPVVFIAVRGTNENPGKPQFADGLGSRAWRTWHYLATKLGVAPRVAGQEPTVVLGAPVHYPATAVTVGGVYTASRDAGKTYLGTLWRDTLVTCPDSEIVVFGYSQGADVVASIWQEEDLPRDRAVGVVLFADPHFNQKWAEQGITLPKGAVYKHNGLLGSRPMFADNVLGPIQAWCWPADPVCQTNPSTRWHGPAYDCYEEWTAYKLAVLLAPGLRTKGFDVPPAVAPTCTPDTRGRGQS